MDRGGYGGPGVAGDPGEYPVQRERADFVSHWPGSRSARYETTRGYVSLGTAISTLIHFSGFPDLIEVFVLDNAAIFSFEGEIDEQVDEITVEAGVFYEPAIRGHNVRARNAVAGAVARVQVVGKWVQSS
jgi:hypothetical protein